MAGANAHQNVSDQIYEALLNKTKTELLVQRSDYYINKLKARARTTRSQKNPKQGSSFNPSTRKRAPSVRTYTARPSTVFT